MLNLGAHTESQIEPQKKKKKNPKLKVFQNIVAIFKINSILSYFLYVGLLGFVVIAYWFHVLL